MYKIFEQFTVDGELTPELTKRKQELDQHMEAELAAVDADNGSRWWISKESQCASIRQKYEAIWEQELTDAGYLVRPVFESEEYTKFEDWYDTLNRLNEATNINASKKF